jgi:TatD DNase family protein
MGLLVDSHCHLDLSDVPTATLLETARAAGVGYFLNVSVDLASFPRVLAAAHQYPTVYASVGVHPNSQPPQDTEVAQLLALADDPKVLAIGETGLDYFRSAGDLNWQHARFRSHIRAARECGKPLIIHCREARDDTLRILREEQAQQVGGIMHCFVEDWDTAVAAMELGFYISFSGIVTFKTATTLQAVARRLPAERLLVETDAPYLAPMPYRGKPNQPAYVRQVMEFIANLRDEAPSTLAATTTENFFRLFAHAQPPQETPCLS